MIQNLNHTNQEDDITHHHHKWNIQQKCRYIALSLQLAKEHMNIWTWEHCCTVAVKRLTNQGLTLATHAHIVSKWHRNFRKHRKFQLRLNSKDLPPFLHANPDICMNIKRYGKENLDILSIEMLRQRGILAKGKKQAIQSKAQEQNLPIEETKVKVIEQGWENKPKGLL